MHEPDWEALADIQFILYNRVANQLNEALSGIALSDMPEGASDKPPGYWKERAATKVQNVLNLFTAWTWLIRFKMGEPIPERAIRPFQTNALLAWVGAQLQLSTPPSTTLNPLLRANQETLQEALLLLYSVAYTQGSGVRLAFEATTLGTWFRVQFDRHRPLPASIDALITSFGDHWRERDTLFEIITARDFIRLNGCELALNSTANHGEFAFFVPAAVGKRRTQQAPVVRPAEEATKQPAKTGPLRPQAVVVPPSTPAEKSKVADTPRLEPVTPPILTAPLPVAVTPPAALTPEGRAAPPGEPEEKKIEDAPQAGESISAEPVRAEPVQYASSGDTPVLPDEVLPPSTATTVIIPAKLPVLRLPERLRTPPASTSNVALPRETQTLARPDEATAAGDSNETSAQEENSSP